MYSLDYADVNSGKVEYSDYVISSALDKIRKSNRPCWEYLNGTSLDFTAEEIYKFYGGKNVETAIISWFLTQA